MYSNVPENFQFSMASKKNGIHLDVDMESSNVVFEIAQVIAR